MLGLSAPAGAFFSQKETFLIFEKKIIVLEKLTWLTKINFAVAKTRDVARFGGKISHKYFLYTYKFFMAHYTHCSIGQYNVTIRNKQIKFCVPSKIILHSKLGCDILMFFSFKYYTMLHCTIECENAFLSALP